MAHEEQNDALKNHNKVARQRYEFAIKCLGDGPGDRPKVIADLGCGMGYGSHLLRLPGHEVTGIDSSIDAIDYANEMYPGYYELENLETYNISGLMCDVIVCIETLCHLKEPQKFIDQLDVKELIISAPIDPDPNDGYKYRLHNLSEKQFKDMLKDWKIIDEFRQQKYLTIYAKKI